jgi:hypothetical protein
MVSAGLIFIRLLERLAPGEITGASLSYRVHVGPPFVPGPGWHLAPEGRGWLPGKPD